MPRQAKGKLKDGYYRVYNGESHEWDIVKIVDNKVYGFSNPTLHPTTVWRASGFRFYGPIKLY